MKLLLTTVSSCLLLVAPLHAAVFAIDISPAGGALNLGGAATHYFGDHAVGLSPTNETGQPASPATGNEVGAGITYDDVTNVLVFDFAYGSAFGFVDLASAFTLVHFHAPGPVNFPAVNTSSGVIHDLAAFHTASTAFSGRVTGSLALSASEETDLFENEIYINIHSAVNGAGELRGQLIPVPEPSASLLVLLSGFLVFRRGR